MSNIQNVYTVAQLSSYIRNMFTADYFLQSVSVKGEVSNCKYHSSGHIYFTLKDPKGTISCVMFAGNRGGLSFRLEDGQQVVVTGSVDVYELGGKYQLYAKAVSLDGMGALYERFEQLKRDLQERGMFDPMYKQPIPQMVKRLGVVTAPTGAAVRDIINIATRRNPYVQILLYPAIVQGEHAAASVVHGIKMLEQKQVDVIIVGRGGGSIEDLWAFNEEVVAQAIFDCPVPIISAVGHETDTTIADFVSDLRAPTPSAAAELAVMDIRELFAKLEGFGQRLTFAMKRQLQLKAEQKKALERSLLLSSPQSRIREKRTRAMQTEERLQECMKRILADKRHSLDLYIATMKGLSPLDKIKSGYSFVEDETGSNVKTVTGLKEGDSLKLYFRDGIVKSVVTEVTEEQFYE